MKKFLTLLISALMAISAIAAPWDGTAAAAFAGGTGTVGDPYQIATAEQLSYLASLANATQTANGNTAGKYYKLTADIDLNGPTKSWTPIGIATATAFAGVFDGDNHIISNIYINDATTVYAGLFGYPTGTSGTNVIIKNLSIASGSITVTNSGSTAGAFAGRSIYAQFINCKNAINVKGVSSVAGIVGTFGSATTTGIIEYCSNSGTITCAGAGLHVGGIAGNAVTASGVSYIRYCYNTGAVTAISNAGGIAGSASGAILTIKECFNKGIISSVNTDAGGIVGLGYGASFNVSNCYNTAVVKQTSSSASSSLNGGILGYPGGTGTDKYFQAITNCYNTGAVTAAKAGGIVEAIAGALKGSTATGIGSVANSYYLSTLSVTNANGGTAKTDTDLKAGAFLTLLNTSSVWGQNASYNSGYPYLLWQVLSTPTVNAASSIIQYGFTANWNAVSNAISYDVKVYDGSSALISTTNVVAGTLSKVITGLIPSTSYTYTVTAKGDNSTYLDSNASAPSSSFSTSATTPWDGTTASIFAGGSGTSIDPYQIATAEQLAYLASLANATQTSNVNTAGKYYKLSADIDLNGPTYSWTPIGIATATAFAGVFDGNNKSIYNIYINDATTLYAGLFGYPTGTSGTNVIIKNLTIASGSIAVTNSGSTAGAFAGRALYTQFINCKNIINISGYNGVGGIVGTFGSSTTTGIIESCSNAGIISGSGASLNVGGIAGNSTVNTTASPISYIRYCSNTGAVNAVSSAGGIAGTNSGNLTIQECFNKGIITASTSNSGGIVGYGYGLLNVLNCNNSGAVRSTHASSVAINGGILGNPGTSGAGKYFTAITNCYNTGAVTAVAAGSTVEAIAGLLAGSGASGTGSVVNSFYLNTLTGITNANGGTGVNAATLEGYAATLDAAKWSSDVSPNKNNGYPILTWQTASNSTLTAPTVGTATSPTTSGFTANWSTVSNALGYTVSVYQNGTNFVQSKSVTGQTTATLAITGLTANTSYTYKVAAISNTGTVDSNESSASATVTTLKLTPTVTVTVGSYTFTGSAQGPNTATNTGTGSSYTFSYSGTGNTVYGTSSTQPTASGTYTVTATVAADGNYASASSVATAFSILSTGSISTDTNVSSLTLSASSNLSVAAGNTLTLDAATNVNSIVLAPTAKLTISAGSVSISNGITLQSDASGTATMLNNGSYTGTITANQYLGTTRNWYVSSPVSNSTSSATNILRYYEYVEAGNNNPSGQPIGSSAYWKGYTPGHSMTAGKGYIALPSATGGVVTFSGTINSGDVSILLSKTAAGYNLIGNPYPSHLTWTQAFVDSKVALIEPTIWYRTNTGDVNSGGNANWSFKTINAHTNEASPVGTTNIIPPMQAFWVKAVAAGTLILNSDLTKSHQSSNLLKAPAMNNSERQRVRLEVSNGTSTDEALIYFDANASDIFDSYDSPRFAEANSVLQIYSTVGSEKLVINGMSSIPMNSPINLGFVSGSASSFSMKAIELTNLPSDVRVILKDNSTLAETDLTDGVSIYNFSPTVNNTDRFSLIFRTSGTSTGIDNALNQNTQAFVNANNQITIIAPEKSNYSIYNAVGQLIENGIVTMKSETLNAKLNAGVYVVKINNQTTRVIVK